MGAAAVPTSAERVTDNGEEAARAAGLRYVSDEQKGLSRSRHGRGFTYRDIDGRTIIDPRKRRWIESLVIPPSPRRSAPANCRMRGDVRVPAGS